MSSAKQEESLLGIFDEEEDGGAMDLEILDSSSHDPMMMVSRTDWSTKPFQSRKVLLKLQTLPRQVKRWTAHQG